MNAVLRKDTLTETYLDMEKLIGAIVWRFWSSYGGDKEVWKAQANYQFIIACDSFPKKQWKFSTWIYTHIWRSLQDYHLKLSRENHIEIFDKEGSGIPFFMDERRTPLNNIIDIMDELKEDGKTLIALILDPPEDMLSINTPNNANIRKGNHACHMKSILKQYLLTAGWTGRRIKESFEEIGAAIYA